MTSRGSPATIAPPRVRFGDAIGIVAPAGAIKPERLRAGLERFGTTFAIALAPSLASPTPREATWATDDFRPTYLAGSDAQRIDELHAMIANPDIRAIILARGGYGIMRILPALDAALLRADPKPIVGFSDATALLAWAYRDAGVRGIHGPMIGQLPDLSDGDIASLIGQLTDPTPVGPRPWALSTRGAGTHVGPLITGNLTLVSLLAGTPWSLPLDEAILLVEEVGERPYEIDRYLTQLALVGELAKPAAFVIGDLHHCEQPGDPPDAALSTILERVRGRPVAVGAPIGHGARNEAVPFGARAALDLARQTFELLDGAVS